MSINKLLEKLALNNLVGIELENDSFSWVKILKSNSIDELIDIASRNNINNFFWGKTNFDIRDFLISYRPERFSSKGIEKIELYNTYIMNLDFEKPYKTTVFIKVDSISIGINLIDDWILDENITDPGVYLEVVEEEDIEDYSMEQLQTYKEHKEQIKGGKEELFKIILKDPEFPSKKNQEIRYYYFIDLMEKEEMKEYRDLLKPYGSLRFGNVKIFMDEAWKRYKESMKDIEE